jgi:hypothetical protein
MVQSIIKTPFDELTYKVIGCAMEVHKAKRCTLWI